MLWSGLDQLVKRANFAQQFQGANVVAKENV